MRLTELISVELPNEYEKESWQLNDSEKSNTIQEFRELGNDFYRNGEIEEAEEKYRAALAIVEQLLLKYIICYLFEKQNRYILQYLLGKSRMTRNGLI